MSVTVSAKMHNTIAETLTGAPGASSTKKVVTHDSRNKTSVLNADSTPPATKCAVQSKALSAGTATIDLTAVAGTEGNVDFSGLKLQVIKLRNPSTNANKITVTKGASNGYGLTGGDSWTIPLAPGDEVMLMGNETWPDVAGGAKTIDLTGTAAQALDYEFVGG